MNSDIFKVNNNILSNKTLYQFINKNLSFNKKKKFIFNSGKKKSIIKLFNFKIKKRITLLKEINVDDIFTVQNKSNKNNDRINYLFFYKYNLNNFVIFLQKKEYGFLRDFSKLL